MRQYLDVSGNTAQVGYVQFKYLFVVLLGLPIFEEQQNETNSLPSALHCQYEHWSHIKEYVFFISYQNTDKV